MQPYMTSFDDDIEGAQPSWQHYKPKRSRLQSSKKLSGLNQFNRIWRWTGSPVLPVTSFHRSLLSVIGTLLNRMASIHHLLSRNWVLRSFALAGIFTDPLFLYIPVINDRKKCLGLDKNLGTALIFVRSFFDFLYIIFRLHAYSLGKLCRRDFSNDKSWETAKKYFLYDFLIDFLSILPLPQGVIWVLIRGWKIRSPMKLLQYIVVVQYVPRLIRIYPLFRKVKKTFRNLYDSTVTKVVFNLLLYMLASHIYGSLWYFLAIERETVCWRRACVNHPGCSHIALYCRENVEDFTFFNSLCPTKQPNATVFDFGIYQDALQSGIVEVTDLPQKFLYSFARGLQMLSSLGQNLRTSSYIWENFFTVLIILSGLMFFLYLIGNMQIYLQSRTAKAEEMRLRGQEIEQWKGFRKLSNNLQQKVTKHRQYVWRETRGVDVENLIRNLPRDLRSRVNSELGLNLLKKVLLFESMTESLLNDLCDLLKPMLYTEDTYFVREGHPIHEMLFVMQGKLSSVATDGGKAGFYNAHYVKDGDFFGDVLISWALNLQPSNNLPISTRSLKALTKVEAFVLKSDDLKFVVSQFRPANEQKEHLYSYYDDSKRSDAARLIQLAWRAYKRRKLEDALRQDEEILLQLEDDWFRPSGSLHASSSRDFDPGNIDFEYEYIFSDANPNACGIM